MALPGGYRVRCPPVPEAPNVTHRDRNKGGAAYLRKPRGGLAVPYLGVRFPDPYHRPAPASTSSRGGPPYKLPGMAVSISSKSVKLRVRRGRVEVLAPPYQPTPYNPNVISAADMRILASAALGRRVNWEDCLAGFAAPGLAATTEGCDHADKWNSPPGTSI